MFPEAHSAIDLWLAIQNEFETKDQLQLDYLLDELNETTLANSDSMDHYITRLTNLFATFISWRLSRVVCRVDR